MSEVTRILEAIQQRDPQAASQLLPLVYDELRRLAAQKLAHEKPGQTLDATALVHEAYLRLLGSDPAAPVHWANRRHFFAAAAEALRRILIESARRKKRHKHGGGLRKVHLDSLDLAGAEADDSILALDEALGRLTVADPEVAEVVKLRYFAGLTIEDAAAAMNLSVRTANRHWAFAKAWLFKELHADSEE